VLTPTDVLQHLAAWGLVGGPTQPITVPPEIDVATLGFLAERHRVTGVVLEALDNGALTSIPDGLVDDIAPRHHRLLHTSLAAEANMLNIVGVLREADVDVRVIKGCATAHVDYDDPALRITGDADLLVPVGQMVRASEALLPYANPASLVPDRRLGWIDRYDKARTIQLLTDGWIDLHQRIASGYFGFQIPPDILRADPVGFTVAGVELAGLNPTMRLLHSALHCASENTGMYSQRDVPVMVTRGADWERVVALATEWHIEALLAIGVRRAWDTFGLDPHPFSEWAARVTPTGRQRLALAVVDRLGVGSQASSWLGLPVREWAPYIFAIAWPSEEYLADAGRSRLAHLARPVRKVPGIRRLTS
jgi:hypothetical protein